MSKGFIYLSCPDCGNTTRIPRSKLVWTTSGEIDPTDNAEEHNITYGEFHYQAKCFGCGEKLPINATIRCISVLEEIYKEKEPKDFIRDNYNRLLDGGELLVYSWDYIGPPKLLEGSIQLTKNVLVGFFGLYLPVCTTVFGQRAREQETIRLAFLATDLRRLDQYKNYELRRKKRRIPYRVMILKLVNFTLQDEFQLPETTFFKWTHTIS